jgi:hypothetical protein
MLVTDSQSNWGDNLKGGEHFKKLYRKVGMFEAVALAGETRSFPLALSALASQDPNSKPLSIEVTGIVVDGKGSAWDYDAFHGTFEKIKGSKAIGSGWAIATAAMRAGADAQAALKITCDLCLFTGGRLQIYRVKG